MKNKIYFLIPITALIFSSCSNSNSGSEQSSSNPEIEKAKELNASGRENAPSVTGKKYDLKSGIITFESMMEMSGMKIPPVKTILYFDDYGSKECKETYEDGKLTESFFSDGKNLFMLSHENKIAVNSGPAYQGTEMRFVWNQVSQSDKDAGKAKQGGKETVAGKECETFTIISEVLGAKTTTKYAGWNHIVLSMELSSADMKSTTKAVKIEENVPVSADKFSVPSGYKVQ